MPRSEEQWQEVSTCLCGAAVYRMGERYRCPDCFCGTLDAMDGLITQINKSTRKINEIRAKIPGKTVDELIKEFSDEIH